MLKISALLAILLCGMLPARAKSVSEADDARITSLTKQQWREDLGYLAKELPKRHKNAFHTVTREQFERAITELDGVIPSLHDNEIFVRMVRIVAKVGDTHTYIHYPKTLQRYPISLFWFGDELRVTRATAAYQRALGARVVRIGEMDLGDVMARIITINTQNQNKWFYRWVTAPDITYPQVLHGLGIVPDATHASYAFEDTEGKEFTLDLRAVAQDAKLEWLSAAKETPLYLQRPAEQFWFANLQDSQTVYVNFKSYSSFSENAEKLLKFIDMKPARRLIIDLRQNGGGDYTKVRRHLIPGLRQREFGKPGNLFVIIGRRTFSAAMNNAVDFRKELKGILVGEPTGDKPNGYAENDEMKLPNSRLVVSYSTRYYKFQDEGTPGVMPDILIEPTWEAYQAGRDPALEWILAQPFSK